MPSRTIPIDAIRQPAWVYGPDGRVTAANDLADALAGQPLAGRSIAEVGRIFQYRHGDGTPFAPDDLPASRAFAGEEVVDLAVTVTIADGREREIVVAASPIRDGDAITGALVLWQDVTERKRAEEAEARLRALMDHNPSLVFLKDEQGRYVYLNESYERQFVHTQDWYGKTDFDFWPAESAELFRANDREVLASGRIHQFLEDSTDLDGTRYVWLNYKFPFTDAQGRRFVGGIGIDATTLVRAEEALAESEEEYRHLVEYAPTGIYEIEYAGPRFRRVNDAMCRVLGYTREELMAMDPGSFLDDESRARFQERARRMIAGEGIDEKVAYRLFARDGREIWAELNVKPTFTDGRMDGALVVAHDITERMRAEEALRESEEKYRTLFASIDEGVALIEMIFDESGTRAIDFRFIETNPAFTRHGGAENVEGRLASELDPHMEAHWLDFYGRVSLTGEPSSTENYSVRERFGRDGEPGERWQSVFASSVGGAGSPLVAVIFNDITERKRAEAALKESQERQAFLLGLGDRLRELSSAHEITAVAAEMVGRHLDANGVVFCEIDGAGECATVRADWNDGTVPSAAGRFRMDDFGIGDLYRRGEIRRTGDVTTALPEDARDEHCALRIRASLGVPVMRGNRLSAVLAVHSATPRTWTDAEVELVREAGDRIWSAVERAKAEAALRESEEKYRGLFESMAEAFELMQIVYDEDGRPVDYLFLDVNPAWERLTGLKRDQVLGKRASEAVGSVERYWPEAMDRALKTGEMVHIENYGVALDKWYDVTMWPYSENACGVTITDITERKRAEAALRSYAENLRRSNEDLERFAYVASHDLQEPLRSIVSFTQLLDRRYRGKLDTEADEYIDFIVDGGNRMQGLILDLLAFSRVNTTRQQIARTDAEDVLAEVERTLDAQLREANATLTHDPLPVVMADPTQLAQVFSNLVSNAIKFRRPDVPLRIHVGARRLDGYWEFSVSDNGIGIEPEYFEKIFVIFQRLHTKDAYPGTGIGLAIVKRIVDRHGGTIRVESTPGAGSTFFFTLPAA